MHTFAFTSFSGIEGLGKGRGELGRGSGGVCGGGVGGEEGACAADG